MTYNTMISQTEDRRYAVMFETIYGWEVEAILDTWAEAEEYRAGMTD